MLLMIFSRYAACASVTTFPDLLETKDRFGNPIQPALLSLCGSSAYSIYKPAPIIHIHYQREPIDENCLATYISHVALYVIIYM